MLPFLRHGPRWQSFLGVRRETDALMFELIDERRAEDGRPRRRPLHAAGRPPRGRLADERPELRDELMTLLVAGHETAASELAWAFQRLAATPRCSTG